MHSIGVTHPFIMNKFLLLVSISLASLTARADDEQRTQATLKQATVFLNRAQLFAQAKATLDAGTTRLIIDNAPVSTDPQSIQVSGKGDAVIQGVQFRTNFLTKAPKPASLQRLDDSLRLNRETLQVLTLQKEVQTDERRLILANQKVGGDKGTTVAEVVAMADFSQKRLTDIGLKLIKIDRQLAEQTKQVARLEAQVNEQNARRERPVGEIEITITTKTRTTVDLDLNYIVRNAGWSPVYDVRIRDTKSPASLAYKASVYQNTGFDWQAIRLTLSTANPAQGGTQPDLGTQYAGFYEPQPMPVLREERVNRSMMKTKTEAAVEAPQELSNTSDFVQSVDQPTNVAFVIALPYTILTNSKPQLVDIQTADIPATYRYEATPKLDADAFLTAQLTGWEKLSLLNGTARIYLEGTYVGESQISLMQTKAGATGDTISMGLGRDKRIVLKREQIEDVSSRKTVGSSIREAHAYRITVRNMKAEPVSLSLYDQVPVSTDSRIEVNATDTGGAELTAETGRLTWRLSLKPNESRVLTFRYEVKYPKGKTLTNVD